MSEEASTSEKALYLMLGAMIGAAAALLLAPRSGEETRKIIASKARESADVISSRTKDLVFGCIAIPSLENKIIPFRSITKKKIIINA